jgi:hypothetical protein
MFSPAITRRIELFRYDPGAEAHFLVARWRIIFFVVGASMWTLLYGLQSLEVIGRHTAAGLVIGVILGFPAIFLCFGGIFGSYDSTE